MNRDIEREYRDDVQSMTKKHRKRTELERLFEVADDHEMQVLDDLRQKAGLTWECLDDDGYSHWTNDESEKICGRCGKAKPKGRGR